MVKVIEVRKKLLEDITTSKRIVECVHCKVPFIEQQLKDISVVFCSTKKYRAIAKCPNCDGILTLNFHVKVKEKEKDRKQMGK